MQFIGFLFALYVEWRRTFRLAAHERAHNMCAATTAQAGLAVSPLVSSPDQTCSLTNHVAWMRLYVTTRCDMQDCQREKNSTCDNLRIVHKLALTRFLRLSEERGGIELQIEKQFLKIISSAPARSSRESHRKARARCSRGPR